MTPDRWNVVVSTYDREFSTAARLLRPFGDVQPTRYRNVLLMHVGDVFAFLDGIEQELQTDASIANSVARISPVTSRFDFASAEEFETKACRAVEQWLPLLAGRAFHVRVHRRGFKHRLSSQHEEQALGHHLLEILNSSGGTAGVDFDDPDYTIVVEIVGGSAGAAIWTREQLREYHLLRFD